MLPAEPFPRLSPPTKISVVPARIEGVHENPVPSDCTFVIFDSGIEKDSPPGMTPRKLGVLSAETTKIHETGDVKKFFKKRCLPLDCRVIPPYPRW